MHKDVWLQYEELLAQEEILWFQKSKAKWLEFGDRNMRYFHGVATVRRIRKHISSLQNEDGLWIEDPRELECLATNFYKGLFSAEASPAPFPLSHFSPS